jgi:hypothetical protein
VERRRVEDTGKALRAFASGTRYIVRGKKQYVFCGSGGERKTLARPSGAWPVARIMLSGRESGTEKSGRHWQGPWGLRQRHQDPCSRTVRVEHNSIGPRGPGNLDTQWLRSSGARRPRGGR